MRISVTIGSKSGFESKLGRRICRGGKREGKRFGGWECSIEEDEVAVAGLTAVNFGMWEL